MFSDNRIRLVTIILIVAGMVWLAYPLSKVQLGLDLKGGVHIEAQIDMVDLQAKLGKTLNETEKQVRLDQAITIIRERINQSGVAEAEVRKGGLDRIVLQIPGAADKEKAENMLTQVGYLEFALVNDDQTKQGLALRGKRIPGYRLLQMVSGKTGETITQNLLVKEQSEFDGTYLTSSNVELGQQLQGPQVTLQFNNKGAKLFASVTRKNIQKRLAIILDNKIVSAPNIQQEIPGGRAVISGQFTFEEAKQLSTILNAGALPAKIEILQSRLVSASLGKDSINKGTTAAIFGLVIVIIFLMIYYMTSGIIAALALTINIVCILGAVVFFKVTLTLPGIAGLILTMGMSVDANVLIFERIREEAKGGKRIISAIKAGYEKAFSTILDANLTTLLTSVILYFFGRGPIKGFALILIIGIITSMFSALFCTRTFFNFLTKVKSFDKLKMLSILKVTNIKFLDHRKTGYVISTVLILAALGGFFGTGDKKYGIDFRGGSVLELEFDGGAKIEELRALCKQENLDVAIQEFGSPNHLLIRAKQGDNKKIKELFKAKNNSFKVEREEEVGPIVGRELKRSSILAIIFSLIGIIFYIKVRFDEMRYSLGAVAALAHDVVITTGIYCLLGKELNVPTVAALLTIVGYSLNDTIVIFDRIRETLSMRTRKSQIELINESINSTLSRTILTSITTLFVITAILVYGGGIIQNFALTLLIGVLVGTYSSIFVATPLVVELHKKQGKKA